MPRRRPRARHRLRRDFAFQLQRRGLAWALRPDVPEAARDRCKLYVALWRAGLKPDWRDFVLSPVLADLEDAIRIHGDWRAHPLLASVPLDPAPAARQASHGEEPTP